MPLLLPSPARVTFDGAWVERAGIDRCEDPSLPPNVYRIAIAASGDISMRWNGFAAMTAMHVTMRQLLRWKQLVNAGLYPVIEIVDQPAFTTRGFMLDISRDKVPLTPRAYGLAQLLGELKFNHAQFYTEHTFAYSGHEPAWRGASPITPDEAHELSAIFRGEGVPLVPNQNCFGHLTRWLKLPEYAHLAETHGLWKFLDFERSGPFSLCPIDERSEAFVADLLRQITSAFMSTPLVNIGCDETFDVGFGRSAAEVDRRAAIEGSPEAGRASLYFEFLSKVAAIAYRLRKRPMLWADIALSHPEMLDRWPRDARLGAAIGLAWGYEPHAPFKSWCEMLARREIPAWVCPGTSTWRSFAGRTTERRGNLRAAAGALESAHPPEGFLLTEWGDCGHMQHWIISQLAIAEGAEAAWRGTLPTESDRDAWLRLHAAVDLHVFNAPGSGLAAWLSELGDLDLELRRATSQNNQTVLFADLFPHTTPRRNHLPQSAFRAVALRLADLRSRLSRSMLSAYTAAQADHTLSLLELAVEHAIAVRSPDPAADPAARVSPSSPDRTRLSEMARAAEGEHRRLWVERNRPGGLDDSCSHLQKVIASLSEPT